MTRLQLFASFARPCVLGDVVDARLMMDTYAWQHPLEFSGEKHHRRSIRLKGFDYSQPGAYFVTICTHKQECMFGRIANGKVFLNQFGRIDEREWLRTREIRRNVWLDEFVIVPNHLHGVLIIRDVVGRGTRHRAYYG